MVKISNFIMIILIILLQFRFWFGENNVIDANNVKNLIEEQKKENENLKIRNSEIYAQIINISDENGSEEMEEKARNNLGMIKDEETFFLIVEEK